MKLDPTTTCSALADALFSNNMMASARPVPTPDAADSDAAIEFAVGLKDLHRNPFISIRRQEAAGA